MVGCGEVQLWHLCTQKAGVDLQPVPTRRGALQGDVLRQTWLGNQTPPGAGEMGWRLAKDFEPISHISYLLSTYCVPPAHCQVGGGLDFDSG